LGTGERFPAPDVPQPNLYQNMSHASQASIWALTPNSAMGMTDDEIASGKFDQPGMMGIQGMSMAQEQEGMGHGGHATPANQDMSAEMDATAESHEKMDTAISPIRMSLLRGLTCLRNPGMPGVRPKSLVT
jgi:hypothetical protein